MEVKIRRCQRVMSNGEQCNAPALRGGDLCRHHIRPIRALQHMSELEALDISDPRNSHRVLKLLFKELAAGTLREDRAMAMLRVMNAAQKESLRAEDARLRAEYARVMERLAASRPQR